MVHRIAVVAVLFLLVATACTESGSVGHTGDEYVRVLWDTERGVMPTPTDLVRDEQEGLAIPIEADAHPAQQQFWQYLNELDGYPVTSTIRIPVSGDINEKTLNRGVRMVRKSDHERVSVELSFDADRQLITVEPTESLEPGETYYVGVRGYEYGLRDVDGKGVVADAPFYLIRSTNPLHEHPDAVPGDTEQTRRENAERMAELQQRMQPAIEAMATQHIERDELAVVTEFTTSTQPAIAYDPSTGEVPLPTDVLIDPDTGTVDLPVDDEMDDEERLLRENLSKLDGFSMSAAITAKSTQSIADNHPTSQNFRLFRQDEQTGDWSEVDDLKRGRLDDGITAWIQPRLTLDADTRYAFVISEQLETKDGRRHRAQPLGALTRLSAPLLDDEGRSTVDQLDDEQAARLEPIRRQADGVLEYLEQTEGLLRSRVAAAVPFRTASSASAAMQRRAELYERDVSTDVRNIETTIPDGSVPLLLTNTEAVLRGEMTVLDYTDPETRMFMDEPVERDAKFVMTLPDSEAASIHDEIPVVLFGHGLMTSRELMYLVVRELSTAGYAALAVDLPLHGSRAICLKDDDCRNGASCNERGECRKADGTETKVKEFQVSYMVPFLEGTTYDDLLHYPVTSGTIFVDMDNLVASRDSFAQGLLDLNQAVRVIRGDELQQEVHEVTGQTLGDEIVYLGMSLGGILGAGLTAIEPEIDDFVLNVPGADLPTMIPESDAFATLFDSALIKRGIEYGTDEYFEFINAARWLFDPIDPLNLAQYASRQTLEYTDPSTGEPTQLREARVQLQMAEGDMVLPNVGTHRLSERMGVEINAYQPAMTDHAFLFDPTFVSDATLQARADMIDFYRLE